jgi:uncharacterized Zn-finger protein
MTGIAGCYPKFRNDEGAREIRTGATEFECVGASPPHDHPHIYIDMGGEETVLCPYCATRYRHDPRLAPWEAFPQGCLLVDSERSGDGRSG